MITKDQFTDWQTHPVTQAVLAEVSRKEKEAVELLVGGESGHDERLRGVIFAYRDIHNIEFEEVE